MRIPATLLALSLSLTAMPAHADADTDHAKMMQQMVKGAHGQITEPGQSAFAAISEIVARLQGDPETDWSMVDIQALQSHLGDMDRVTLHTIVTVTPITGGAVFNVKGEDAAGHAAVRRMMLAHAPFLAAATGFAVAFENGPEGSQWKVTSDQPSGELQIRGLGFYGLLAVGGHHQAHHLAIATGQMMH
jgi:hypothetical protein